ncbi:MAG: type II secretion system minor pseudopilin GspI [Pseudomonadota bacterium]
MASTNQRGLTLIEVLVALAILSLAVGSLLVLLGQHSRNAAAIEDRALARIVAENALVAYIAASTVGDAKILEGDEEVGGRVFLWEIDRDTSQVQGFERVDVSARREGSQQVIADLSTLQKVAPNE